MKKIVAGLLGLILLLGGVTTQAQEQLKVKFRSRALLDAAVSGYGKEDVQGYYRLEDFRVGQSDLRAVGGESRYRIGRR